MNKRIRYVNNEDGTKISTRVIQTSHGEMKVKFNPSYKVVHILSAVDERVLHSFVGTTTRDMQTKIKEYLLKMGAEFEPEMRVPKGKVGKVE